MVVQALHMTFFVNVTDEQNANTELINSGYLELNYKHSFIHYLWKYDPTTVISYIWLWSWFNNFPPVLCKVFSNISGLLWTKTIF